MRQCVPLEKEAEEICRQSPPFSLQLTPDKGRETLERAQDFPVYKYPARISVSEVDTGKWGKISIYIVKPENQVRRMIFYIHGAGWVFGSFHTHEKLVRELAARTDSLIIFPEYSRAPEAKYPTALEQCFYIFSHIWEIAGGYEGLQDTLTVAGDSVGGNMAIALTILSDCRNAPRIRKLLLYYPVTNACFDTYSYRKFAEGYYLYRTGMQWFWNQYTVCEADRKKITVSPLLADKIVLRNFPETMIINGQADVLRSEGEAFGEKLRRSGADVTALRVQGTIHDFVMLNALDLTRACRIAMDASVMWINRSNT